MVSSGTAREMFLLPRGRVERHGSLLSLLWHPLWWEDSLGYNCWWCLAEVSWLFSKARFSVLLGSPFPGTFAGGSRLLFGLFFCCFLSAHVCIPDCELLQLIVYDIWNKKENPENSPPFCSLGLEVPSQSPFLSRLSESSYVCFI